MSRLRVELDKGNVNKFSLLYSKISGQSLPPSYTLVAGSSLEAMSSVLPSSFGHSAPWLCCFIPFLILLWRLFFRTSDSERTQRKNIELGPNTNIGPVSGGKELLHDLERVRELYHQLHHLESFPCAPGIARDVLGQALDRAVASSSSPGGRNYNILDIASYSRTSLTAWIRERDLVSTRSFQEYNSRRASGGPLELIKTRPAAKKYLQAQAPLRYVDGAWLGRVSRARAPWKDQKVLQSLWLTLSEELGDGDLAKHHTHIYHELLLSLEPEMPVGHSKEFCFGHWGADNERVWRSGLVQLMISLFQDDFLPEMLGFNLHFEGITPEMMIASVETRELGLNPAYFLLHIAIDNAHSGHTAMALDAVCDYIDQCIEEHGRSEAERVWRRVQSGYLLSEGRWNTSDPFCSADTSTPDELRVAELFANKSEAGCDVHCTSNSKLGGRRIVDWLNPTSMADRAWRTKLVRKLGESRYWITPGASSSSRFMREILWPGRMFGAFTDSECKLVQNWIQSLPVSVDGAYLAFIGAGNKVASAVGTNATTTSTPNINRMLLVGEGELFKGASERPVESSERAIDPEVITNSPYLPALWFSHLCLLEGFTAVPSRNANRKAQSAIRMLRAQNGLSQPTHSVTGTDSCNANPESQDSITLIDIGLQLLCNRGLAQTESLAELLKIYPSNSLVDVIMDVSTAPYMHTDLILGMASSFAALYRAVAQSGHLNAASCHKLFEIAAVHDREAIWFLHEQSHEGRNEQDFIKGVTYVRQALQLVA